MKKAVRVQLMWRGVEVIKDTKMSIWAGDIVDGGNTETWKSLGGWEGWKKFELLKEDW